MNHKRNGAIDFWKFIFAIEIMCFHLRGILFGGGYFQGGYLAVEFFFIVSGMMMAASSERNAVGTGSVGKDTFLFMKKKIGGLMPNYYIAWLITFSVIHIAAVPNTGSVGGDLLDSMGELLFLRSAGVRGFFANGPVWYLSAMLIAMLVLYPLLRKYKDSFYYVIAPIGFVFLLGITYQNFETLTVEEWYGVVSSSLIRAVMEILFGCICYKVAQEIRKWDCSLFSSIVISIIEVGIYLLVLTAMIFGDKGQADWQCLILFGICITLTYSQQGILAKHCTHKMFGWLGEFSFNLYLGHYAVSRVVYYMECSKSERSILYLVGTVVNSLFLMYVSKGILVLWGKIVKKRKAQ